LHGQTNIANIADVVNTNHHVAILQGWEHFLEIYQTNDILKRSILNLTLTADQETDQRKCMTSPSGCESNWEVETRFASATNGQPKTSLYEFQVKATWSWYEGHCYRFGITVKFDYSSGNYLVQVQQTSCVCMRQLDCFKLILKGPFKRRGRRISKSWCCTHWPLSVVHDTLNMASIYYCLVMTSEKLQSRATWTGTQKMSLQRKVIVKYL
jgi:hypothetical protein